MRLDDLVTADGVLAEDLQDPAFREKWERTALAREVALAVTAHRAERGLTQAALGRLAGLTQPQIARLEAGDHEPRLETLDKLARALGLRFRLEVGAVEAPVVDLYAVARLRAASLLDRREGAATGADRKVV
ncbi:MAG: helix-turn-helix transcriptional regulator [Frankia sp.]